MRHKLNQIQIHFCQFIRGRFLAIILLMLGLAPAAHADWAKGFSGLNGANVSGADIKTDSSGNIYLLGSFNSLTLDIGNVTLNRIGVGDSFVAKMDSSGTILWAKNFGGSGATINPNSIAVDISGNVYIGGSFDTASLTTPALTKIGIGDAVVIKLDSSGNTTWAKNYGGSGAWTYGQSIDVDSGGNVYLGGYFYNANLTTPAITKIGSNDAFAIKLDSSGNTTWSKNYGGSGAWTYGQSIAVDVSGSVYLGGYFQSANLTTPALTKIGNQDAFAIKLNSSGTTTWAQNYGGSSANTFGFSIAADVSGSVYLGGYFQSANLTAPALTKIGNQDAFAIKLDSSGTTTWAKNYGGSGAGAAAYRIAVDASGNVYLGGYFGTANMTTPALTKIGTADAFAIKLDSSGATTWAKNFGGSGAGTGGWKIAVDISGNVYLGGYFQSASLTTPALTKVGSLDTYTIKLDSSGNTTWSQGFGGFKSGGTVSGGPITKDSSGNIYVAGYFDSLKASIGSITLNRIGAQDAFVAKTDISGTVQWAKNFGGSGATTDLYSIAVDTSGNVYLAGYFESANLTTPALTKIGTKDAFALKLDSSGTTTWSKNYGGAGASAYANGIAVDGSANVYLGGQFQSANLTTPALTKIGATDAFAFKLDSSGATTWSKNYGGSGASTNVHGIAVDVSGSVYLGGSFQSANLTTPAVTKIGTSDALVIKLDSSGTTTWAKNYGGVGASAYGNGIAVDVSGSVYLGGYFSGASLSTPSLSVIGFSDSFAFKLDSSGNATWAKNFGGSLALTFGNSIAIDALGNVYLGGYFASGNMTTPALNLIGIYDTYVIKLNPSGTTTWSKNYGGSGVLAVGSGITTDGTGNIYIGGYFSSGNLTTPALTKLGTSDAFLLDTQLFRSACTTSGKIKYDSSNNVMVFCDGSYWRSMNNSSASTCTGTTNGKLQYYSNGGSSDFVWYGGSCRSAKSTSTTYGACAVNGKIEWDAAHSTIRGCVNGTWNSLLGW